MLSRWEQKKKRIDKHRQLVSEIKSTSGCKDCGFDNPIALEFDHVKGVKSFSVAYGVSTGKSMKAIKDEIAKCEVVCANCHALRTASRREAS